MRLSNKTLLATLLCLNALLIGLVLITISSLPAILQFTGRLHPLILHFPIVLILAGFLFEIITRFGGKSEYQNPAGLLLWLGAFTAAVSAIAGYLLSINGGYGGSTFTLHQWFGVATSLVALVLLIVKSRETLARFFIPTYAALSLLLVLTGHFGASLTHGEDFLTEVFEKETTLALNSQEPVFSQVVMPILDDKCASCHNPNKLKGNLSLASQTEILKGGENGKVLIAGDPKGSTLISHLLLPTEEDLHMPPKGKPQLTNEEIKMLEWWVESGASFDNIIQDIPTDDPIQVVFASYFNEEELDIDFVSVETISSVNSKKVSVEQIEEDKPYLAVYAGQHPELELSEIKALKKVREQVYSLDLGGSKVTKDIIKEVSRFKNLHRLYLDNTAVDDGMVSSLKRLKELKYLNLYNTQVSKKGVNQVLKSESLEKLFIWQTQVNSEDLEVIQANNPSVQINGGSLADGAFEEVRLTTPRLVFESSFFAESMVVEVPYNLSGTEIYYQLDSEEPKVLEGNSIELRASTKVSVFARKEGWKDSETAEQVFIRVRDNDFQSSQLRHDPKGSYQAKGVKTLFDLQKGSENFRDGQWLGFSGDDMITDISLPTSRTIESVYISTLDDTGSWIFPPTSLEVWGGTNKNDMKKLKSMSINPPEGPEPKHLIIHQLSFDPTNLKYLRIVAKNYGDLPEWHPGKDTPAWLFIDEIAFQ